MHGGASPPPANQVISGEQQREEEGQGGQSDVNGTERKLGDMRL
jgi:hypothetical protein